MIATLPDASDLQRRLDQLIAQHRVPGAVVGVLCGDDLLVRAAGLTRLTGGAPVTPDTLFLIASVTKVWTATLVLQLVDEGRVDLDAPVNRYLDPPLQLADRAVAKTVTVRQLLTHSGGFFGDADEPPGEGEDAVRQTVASYAGLHQLHPPGRLFSYSNAGFNVLGRMVECLTTLTWDDALQQRLIEPLGLRHTHTRLERAATHLLAVGHEPKGPDTLSLEPVSVWLDPRGSGPCGGTLATTAADLLAFARLHIRDGLGPDGHVVLSSEAAKSMRAAQISQPDPAEPPAWGLGWALAQAEDPQVVEHDGNTCGQHSQLVVVPERGLAVCVLANGDTQRRLRKDLTQELLRELVGVDLPSTPSPGPPDRAPDPSQFVGSYQRDNNVRIDIARAGGGLTISFQTSGEAAQQIAPFTVPLTHATGSSYLFTMPRMDEPLTATFVSENGPAHDRESPPTHLSVGVRLAPRVEGS